ncbi:DUF1302 domain-containing protein [Limnobacter sp.]|uniref:DUF1302 domain-containing protein n=1 Tax=Limnobacter sp. TaxID=2003368 RepID=UPI0027346639|nr:DUF1302 domain-containing protein [Limnobacter sp.]MDP3189189.1 DUF1302 domain-containing protein [Limnobacter sp.]
MKANLAVLAACLACSTPTHSAGDFEGPAGTRGRWAMEMTVGSSMRLENAHASVVSIGNGGTAASNTVDDGNLNYANGDVFSSVAKAVGELELTKDNVGAFVRAKAYSDFQTPNKGVDHGSSKNAYIPGQKPSDSGFPDGSRFEDAQLLDAFGFASFEPMDKPLTIKFGRQVVTWGEALFVLGGVNQYSNFDVAALRRPGAQLKEVFLPIPQVSANLQATQSLSIETFAQLNHEKVVIDGCGTLFSPADLLNCGNSGSGLNPGALALGNTGTFINFSRYTDRQTLTGGGDARVETADGRDVGPASTLLGQAASTVNFKMDEAAERRPSDKGQIGLAARFFAAELGTEFGVYAVNYHQRIPNLSLVNRPTNNSNSIFSGQGTGALFQIPGLSYFFDWGAEDIQVLGFSAATELAGWSLFGEVSFTKDYPVPYNTPDLIKGAATGTGPLSQYRAQANNGEPGTVVLAGSKPLDKIQMQASTIKLFPRRLGASAIALVGEIGAQMWKGIGDPFTGERFGRSPVFGAASHAMYNNGQCNLGVNASANLDPRYCAVDGFATETAAGYRLLAVFQYPDLLAGINFSPRAFIAHDFLGTSADGVFLENRINLGLGLKGEIKSGKYFADLSLSLYDDKAFYDPLKDKDFMSFVLGANL